MAMNALQKALVEAGLAEEPKFKKPRYKKFNCNKCGYRMTQPDDCNFMYCENCGAYFIFSHK